MIWAKNNISKAVFSRLGYPEDAIPDANTSMKVDEIIHQLLAAATPRVLKKECTLIELESLLSGKDINRHLTDCSHCLLMAATLGAQIDTLIRKASVSDMNEAVIMDAASSELIEAVMEDFEAQVREEYHHQRRYVTSRFSPGYGDFSIAVQNEFVDLLDTGRKIGLYATPSHILTPRKSITAVCGISTKPVTGHLVGCGGCTLEPVCRNKKGGITCARKHI